MSNGESEALAVIEAPGLSVSRAPEVVLEEAQKAAAALKKVIDAKPRQVKFNGQTYLTFEDWQTVGRFYGVTVRIREVRQVSIGEAQGFEAFAEALMVSTNQVISAADAMCLNDEGNWSKKPWFQLRSMAQTRACAKALRNALAWVVVLAGYSPTPAEEMGEGSRGPVRTVTGVLEEIKAFEHCSIAKVNGEKLVVLDTGFDSELVGKEGKEVTVQVTEAVGPKGKYWEVTGIVKKAQGTQLERQLGASIKQVEAQKPKPEIMKPAPKTPEPKRVYGGSGKELTGVVEVVKGPTKAKSGKGSWMMTKLVGFTVFWWDDKLFPYLKGAEGKFCKFIVKPGRQQDEYSGMSVLTVGDAEWLEDGTPVIRRDGVSGVFDEPQNVQALDEPLGGPEAA